MDEPTDVRSGGGGSGDRTVIEYRHPTAAPSNPDASRALVWGLLLVIPFVSGALALRYGRRGLDGNNLEIYWNIDQVGTDGTVRAAAEWLPAKSLEDAVANPVKGQTLPRR